MNGPSKQQRILTGIKPTGTLHLGNYMGAIRPAIEFSKQSNKEVILLCADWHGLTNRAELMLPGQTTNHVLAALYVCGFQIKGNMLLKQSAFPQILEISWYLNSVTSVGLLERAHAYKDALANGKEPTGALLYYPVLMAADILTFAADQIPVGKDQAQHLEYASDLARHFNTATQYKVFKEPKALIQETPLLLGTCGQRKMSKSYNNTIPLFAPKKEIEKRIKEITTDSRGVNEPKDPDSCLIFQIFKSFASDEAKNDMATRLQQSNGYGYGHAKKDFLDEHERVFGSKREHFEHLIQTPQELKMLTESCYAQAHKYANATLNLARQALNLQ